jgi:hypothetical protein
LYPLNTTKTSSTNSSAAQSGIGDPAGGRQKKALRAAKRRELAAWMQERFKVSVHRSCRLALLQRSTWYAKSEAWDQSALRQRIRDIALSRPRFGYLRVLVMLKREGWQVGKKRVYRLYRLEGLQLHMKVKRHKRIALMRGKLNRPGYRGGSHCLLATEHRYEVCSTGSHMTARLGLCDCSHVDAANRYLANSKAQQLCHARRCHRLATGQSRAKTHGMSTQQNVLYSSTERHHAFDLWGFKVKCPQTNHSNHQAGRTVCLFLCSLDLLRSCAAVAIYQRPCKDISKMLAFFNRNDDEPPGNQTSVVRRGCGKLEELLQLLLAGTRSYQAFGQS